MTTSGWHKVHENTYIIYTLLGIAIILLIFSITLHFQQHFKCQSCYASTPEPKVIIPRQRSRTNSILETSFYKRFRCICAASDGEDFDFFPMAFFIYLIYVLLVCTLLILKLIMVYININNSWKDTLNVYKYPSFNDIISINEFNYNAKHSNIYDSLATIIDICSIYLIMFMSLIESLFTFYRFYTTLMTTKHLLLITIKDVLKRFIFYTLLFVILYAITIHLYFWIFPFVILIHCVFNIYCNLRFASILIMNYTSMMNTYRRPSVDSFDNTNQEILEVAQFMRKISIICTIIQATYLSLFMVIYYVNINLIIIYLPILWCISSFMFSLNFARNRLVVLISFNKISQKCKDFTTQPRVCCCKSNVPRIDSQVVISSASTIAMPTMIGNAKMDDFETIQHTNNENEVNNQSKPNEKHVVFDIKPEDNQDTLQHKQVKFNRKDDKKPQYDLRITAPEHHNDNLKLNPRHSVLSSPTDETPLPTDEDTPLTNSRSNKNTPRDMAMDTPSKSDSKGAKFQRLDSTGKQVAFKDYASNSIQMNNTSANVSRQGSDRSKQIVFKDYASNSMQMDNTSVNVSRQGSDRSTNQRKHVSFKDYASDTQMNNTSVNVSRQRSDQSVNQSRTKLPFNNDRSGVSVEYTMHSRFEMSVQSEYDMKPEEFNKYLNNNRNRNEDSMPNSAPAVPLHSSLYDQKERTTIKNTNLNAGMDIGVIDEGNEETETRLRLSVHEHKLDVKQLMLQLTLLKKFGFDVRDMRKSFSASH